MTVSHPRRICGIENLLHVPFVPLIPIALAVAWVSMWLMLTCQRLMPSSFAIRSAFAGERDLRLAAGLGEDLDVGPGDPAAPAGAQHLQHRFLGREPAGQMLEISLGLLEQYACSAGVKTRSRKCWPWSSTSLLIRAVSTMSIPWPRMGIAVGYRKWTGDAIGAAACRFDPPHVPDSMSATTARPTDKEYPPMTPRDVLKLWSKRRCSSSTCGSWTFPGCGSTRRARSAS